MRQFSIFFFFSLIFVVKSDTTASPGSATTNSQFCKKTFDHSLVNPVTWYPYNFEGVSPPQLPYNYTCEFQINVLYGWYAAIELTVDTVPVGTWPVVQVIDDLSGTQNIFSSPGSRYFFIASGGKITVNTGNKDVKFGFKVVWDRFSPAAPFEINVSPIDKQPKIVKVNSMNKYTALVGSYIRVDATIIPPPPSDPYGNGLRGTLFFDGPNWNYTCLGNGWKLMQKRKVFTEGNYLTIMFLGNYYEYDDVRVLVQEHNDDIYGYKGFYCQEYKSCGTIQLNATGETVALQPWDDYSDTHDVITGIDVITGKDTGVLEVYNGRVTKLKTNRVASYQLNNIQSMLPQMFPGRFVTYVLTGAIININMTRNQYYFETTQNIGRSGYIFSNDYGLTSTSQSIFQIIFPPNGTDIVKFRLQVQKADLKNGNELKISTYYKNYYIAYSASNLPTIGKDIELYGHSLVVEFSSNDTQSSGFYTNFFVESISSSGFQAFIIFVFVIFNLL